VIGNLSPLVPLSILPKAGERGRIEDAYA